MKLSSPAALAALLLSVLALGGCDTNTSKVSDILDNPSKYETKQVAIAGHVTQVYPVSPGVSGIAAYQLRDDTAQMWVITHAGTPNIGDAVGVQGKVEKLAGADGAVFSGIHEDVVDEQQRRAQ